MDTPAFDMESFSTAGYYFDKELNRWGSVVKSRPYGIGAVGAAAYAEHPSTEILKISYDLKDGRGIQLWVKGMDPPTMLINHVCNGGILEATNYFFEFTMWNEVAHKKMGWPKIELRQMRDAAAKARNWSLSPGLDGFTKILNTPVLKSDTGKKLIKMFTYPETREGWTRKHVEDYPEEDNQFNLYNLDDTVSQSLASNMMPPLSDTELEIWYYSERVNEVGAHVNREKMNACIKIVELATKRYTLELQSITSGEINTIGQTKKLQAWLHARGVEIDNMQKETIAAWLERPMPPECFRVLEIRALLSSASVMKLYAMNRRISRDGRIRGLFFYQGADRSGRYSAKGPQPHNIPGGGPPVNKCVDCGGYFKPSDFCPSCGSSNFEPSKWCHEAALWAMQSILTGDLDYVERFYGDAVRTVSGCLRSLYEAPPGYELVSSDYSAIEAVILAVIAGEQWRIDVFNSHGKIYETSAAKITGIPFEEFAAHKERTGEHHPMRGKIGKVAELASGYQGWIGAWKAFGADKHFENDAEIRDAILKWREESPNIVEFWGGQIRKVPGTRREFHYENYGLEGAVVDAIQHPGITFYCRSIEALVFNDVLHLKLPSGRYLYYHQPRLHNGTDKYSKLPKYKISYMGHNTDSKKGPYGWILMWTYGGKLTENVVQAIARDILAHALVNVQKTPLDRPSTLEQFYQVVIHVHDELAAQIPIGCGSVERLESIMNIMPPWAEGWPIFARGGWVGKSFRKG